MTIIEIINAFYVDFNPSCSLSRVVALTSRYISVKTSRTTKEEGERSDVNAEKSWLPFKNGRERRINLSQKHQTKHLDYLMHILCIFRLNTRKSNTEKYVT